MSTDPLDGTAIHARLEALARFTDVPGEMTRLTLSAAHKLAADQVMRWFTAAGLNSRIDATGSVIGRMEGTQPDALPLIIGSHIDTVRNAGIYDGNLGVLVALAAIEQLQADGRPLPFPIEIAAFADEEGVRFPSTLTSSRALAGRFDAAMLDHADAEGIIRRAALVAFGADPDAYATESRAGRARGYVEVHIEQGPVLAARGLPVGLVTAIAGATRGVVRVTGQAGHSGTLPMDMRQDALAGAAEMILAVERRADAPGLVATVGTLAIPGGAVNTVPGAVQFSLDVRAPEDSVRLHALADMEARFREIAAARGLSVAIEIGYEAAAAPCDPAFQAGLAEAIAAEGVTPFYLPSGAGHDGLSFNGVLPIAMLFARSENGSHNPREHASPEDIGTAARVLHRFLRGLEPDRV
ncbi:M20 family metallo-hydrolase [Xanthobacteraceae bacterium A53D]